MIITCPNCNKQFKIDNSLIPDEGRDLQCGSCNHIWFYNIQEKNNEVLELKQEIISENIETKAENKDDKIFIGSINKLKLKNKGKDVFIYQGKDLLAKVKGAKGNLSKIGEYLV